MKVFISADIEGVNGILSWPETEKNTPEYHQFQKQMTKEVVAACVAAKEAGATEIVIKDAHDSASNLVVEDLPEYVTLVRGWSSHPYEMMQELDESFDCAFMIGYHSASRSDGNPLSHTKTNMRLHHIKINGEIMSEFKINTLLANFLNAPVVFVSGDDSLSKEVKAYNEHIETVITNKGVGNSIVCPHPSVTINSIKEQVKQALSKDLKQCLVPLPEEFNVEICFRRHQLAYRASFYPGVTKVNGDTVTFKTNDYFEVLRLFLFTI